MCHAHQVWRHCPVRVPLLPHGGQAQLLLQQAAHQGEPKQQVQRDSIQTSTVLQYFWLWNNSRRNHQFLEFYWYLGGYNVVRQTANM